MIVRCVFLAILIALKTVGTQFFKLARYYSVFYAFCIHCLRNNSEGL